MANKVAILQKSTEWMASYIVALHLNLKNASMWWVYGT
jgi:hypothetical protein